MDIPETLPRTAKQAEVVRAATGVFLRYGYARTTMGDIATAAGVSRPALYLVFPGKEEIFAAVIYQMDADTYTALHADLLTLPTLEAKLQHVCAVWGAHGFEIMEAHPDARDLFDLTVAPVRKIYANFQAFIASMIADAVAASGISATASELARVLVFAMRGFKDTATSTSEMRRLIAVQVDLLVAALRLNGR